MDVARTTWVYVVGGSLCFVGVLKLLYASRRHVSDWSVAKGSVLVILLAFVIMADYQAIDARDYCRTLHSQASCLATRRAAGKRCLWNRQGRYGSCADCWAVCHDPHLVLNIEQYFVGFGLLNVGFVLGRTALTSLFSHLLSVMNQGPMMGLLVASGCVARIVGPQWAMGVYEWDALAYRRTYPLMLSLVALFLLNGAVVLWVSGDVQRLLAQRAEEEERSKEADQQRPGLDSAVTYPFLSSISVVSASPVLSGAFHGQPSIAKARVRGGRRRSEDHAPNTHSSRAVPERVLGSPL